MRAVDPVGDLSFHFLSIYAFDLQRHVLGGLGLIAQEPIRSGPRHRDLAVQHVQPFLQLEFLVGELRHPLFDCIQGRAPRGNMDRRRLFRFLFALWQRTHLKRLVKTRLFFQLSHPIIQDLRILKQLVEFIGSLLCLLLQKHALVHQDDFEVHHSWLSRPFQANPDGIVNQTRRQPLNDQPLLVLLERKLTHPGNNGLGGKNQHSIDSRFEGPPRRLSSVFGLQMPGQGKEKQKKRKTVREAQLAHRFLLAEANGQGAVGAVYHSLNSLAVNRPYPGRAHFRFPGQ